MGKDASPAPRHAVWIAALSLLAAGAGAWVGWQVFGGLGALLGFLACLLAAKFLLLAVFIDRFLTRLLRSSVRVRPSRTHVSDSARGHVDHLRTLGFVLGETLVMVDDNDQVLGGPHAMLSHSTKPMAACADEECERAYFRGMSRLERARSLLRLTRGAEVPGVGA